MWTVRDIIFLHSSVIMLKITAALLVSSYLCLKVYTFNRLTIFHYSFALILRVVRDTRSDGMARNSLQSQSNCLISAHLSSYNTHAHTHTHAMCCPPPPYFCQGLLGKWAFCTVPWREPDTPWQTKTLTWATNPPCRNPETRSQQRREGELTRSCEESRLLRLVSSFNQ